MLKPERNFKRLLQFPKMCHPELWLCGELVGVLGYTRMKQPSSPLKHAHVQRSPPEGLC